MGVIHNARMAREGGKDTFDTFVKFREGTPCFMCSQALSENEVIIFWAGHGCHIYLHPKCALYYAKHLISDYETTTLSIEEQRAKKLGCPLGLPAKTA